MLSVEANERLTRVGPGTPMGELMRRYWLPIGRSNKTPPMRTAAHSPFGRNLC